jgi:(4S)-4-hydroxy-5-phosphonooxypentane-2,3-dione isomerase
MFHCCANQRWGVLSKRFILYLMCGVAIFPYNRCVIAFTIQYSYHQPWRTGFNDCSRGKMRIYETNVGDSSSADCSSNNGNTEPFAIIVQAEIVPERLSEFMQLIEHNALQSRKEPQCIRFDIVRSQEQDNKFFFYEIYTNNHSAIEHHKSQPHYQAWADFKDSGGTISSSTYKANGLFVTE